MHQSQAYIDKIALKIQPTNITDYVFDPISASAMQTCLLTDASDYIYSASVSIADAINGVRRGLLSWATVKLYYSVYYACKGILAVNSVGIIYLNRKPYIVTAISGTKIAKKNGQTHKVVLNEFHNRNIDRGLLSQEIELQSPLFWLMEKRETANYKNSRFWEPDPPDHFKKILDVGIRKAVNAYVTDFDLYAFDPEHAILAYPIKSLVIAYDLLKSKGGQWSDDDKKYVANLFKDDNGILTELHRVFR
ncbi:MAG: hypothetical protein HOP27_13170 [Anaerolineales bacterium]|nr:hypothetical protein [Anaerolineales bacterium]